jgi:adenine nucleotide transporter 17
MFLISYILAIFMVQGVYYYFYQIFRNKAEAASLKRMKIGIGDGSVGMFSSLVVAALSG